MASDRHCIGLVILLQRRRIVTPQWCGEQAGVCAMKRSDATRKVVDLGKATRETKGGTVGLPDIAGQQAPFGLTND